MFGIFASIFAHASEDCDYYINHQVGRFIYSVESTPAGIIDIEYYFKDELDAYNFIAELGESAHIEKSDLYEVGKKVTIKHKLQLPRFALENWFSSHYQKVCSYRGYINNWVIKNDTQS
jgi:hypothetical protein